MAPAAPRAAAETVAAGEAASTSATLIGQLPRRQPAPYGQMNSVRSRGTRSLGRSLRGIWHINRTYVERVAGERERRRPAGIWIMGGDHDLRLPAPIELALGAEAQAGGRAPERAPGG